MGRRTRGEGTLYRRRDGRWAAAVTVNGRRIQRTFRAGSEGRRAALEWLRSVRPPASGVTLGQALDLFLQAAAGRLAPQTVASYRSARRQLTPFDGLPLDRIPDPELIAFILSQGATVRMFARTLIRGAFTTLGLEPPPLKALGPPPPRRQPRALTAEEAARLLAAAEAFPPAYLLIRLGLITGLRIGELLAIRGEDVDRARGELAVVRSIRGPLKRPTQARRIALDPETAALIPDRPGPVFNISVCQARRLLKTVCSLAGIAPIGYHQLRHTAATLLLGAGISPRVVAQRLGHARPEITLARYAHVLPGQDRIAAETLALILRGANGSGAESGPGNGQPGVYPARPLGGPAPGAVGAYAPYPAPGGPALPQPGGRPAPEPAAPAPGGAGGGG